MSDTEVAAAATLVGAFGGVALGALLAWLVERSRRRFEARMRLAEERAEAWTWMSETATESYRAIQDTIQQYQSSRWWQVQGFANYWLAKQGYQRALAARREMLRVFFDIRRLGPPPAVELAGQLVAVVEAAAELVRQPRSRQAMDQQTWSGLLERLTTAREALLEFPAEPSAGRLGRNY
jgi:hypothetical protein